MMITRFRFGFLDAALNSRLGPTALTRASYLMAAATGADSYWIGDHLNALLPRSIMTPEHFGAARFVPRVDANFEVWTMLGHLSAKNTIGRLRLGVGVTDAGRRNPAVTAQAAATLHLLTKGRAILGIGTGEREGNEPYGVDWTKPVARFEEAVATIRALWDSGGALVSRDSAFFPLRDAVFDLPAYRGKWPQIWVAAHGPRMLRATGRYADGWLPVVLTRPTDYAHALKTLRDAASDAGRDPLSITPGLVRTVITGRNRDEVDEVLDSVVVKSVALSAPAEAWARHGVTHPLGVDFRGVHDVMPQTMDESTVLSWTADVPASLLRESSFCGTPDDVVDQVAEWRDFGLRYPLLVNAGLLQPSPRKSAESIVPYVKILRRLRKL